MIFDEMLVKETHWRYQCPLFTASHLRSYFGGFTSAFDFALYATFSLGIAVKLLHSPETLPVSSSGVAFLMTNAQSFYHYK